MPQLVALADQQFLHEFASKVFFDEEHPECEDKTHVVPTLLTTAISQATLYKPKPLLVNPLYRIHRPGTIVDEPDKAAKIYVQKCFKLGCPQLVGTVIERVISSSSATPTDAEDCAKSIMLPLATFVTEQLRVHPEAPPIPQVETLRTTAMKLYLDWVAKNSRLMDRREVAKLLAMCVVNGDATVFMTT